MKESFFSGLIHGYVETEAEGRHPPAPYAQESCQNTGETLDAHRPWNWG